MGIFDGFDGAPCGECAGCDCTMAGDGIIFTATATGYYASLDVQTVDSSTIDLSGAGTSVSPLTATVIVDPDSPIISTPTGLDFDNCVLTDNLNDVTSGQVLVKGADPDCLAYLDPSTANKVIVSDGTEFVLGDAAAPEVVSYCDSTTGDPVGYGVIDTGNTLEKFYDLDGVPVASKPATWEPCCCCDGSSLGIVNFAITGGGAVSVDSGVAGIPPDTVLRSSPIGTMTITNSSPSSSIEVVYVNQYIRWSQAINPRGITVGFTPLSDPGTGTLAAEPLNMGAGFTTTQITGTVFIAGGSGGAGSTEAVNTGSSIGFINTLTIGPGASKTIRYQITAQIASATNATGNIRVIGYAFPQIISRRFI